MNKRNLLREIKRLKGNPDNRIELLRDGQTVAIICGGDNEVRDGYGEYRIDGHRRHGKDYLLYSENHAMTVIIDDYQKRSL